MSTEQKITSTETPSEQVSTAVIPEGAIANTDIAPELNNAEEAPPVTTTEEGVVNATEVAASPSPATTEETSKVTVTKRRTIFNPFGKPKKEEPASTDDAQAEAPATSEEKTTEKKKAKGFGTFFSRSKSAPKIDDAAAESEAVTTELPQIEQLQPIDAAVTEAGTEAAAAKEAAQHKEETVTSAVGEVVDNIQQEVTDAVHELENAVSGIVNKRQSFISKFFGVETTAVAATTEEKPSARPSSPLGRLTELFTKKKEKKAKASEAAATETTEAAATTEEKATPQEEGGEKAGESVAAAVEETSVAENVSAKAPAPVVASA
ncbi:hypothetical protein K501DRAFT_268983 [Backusella circina FSU 941]|nr:hypothetical protein K501DRAFT_268983 [Backusella circina FSU 941]